MLLQSYHQVRLGDRVVLIPRTLRLGSSSESGDTGLLLFPMPPLLGSMRGDAFHTEDLNVESISPRECVGKRFRLRLVHLLRVHHETARGVQLSRTQLTLEVLRLLVLQKDCCMSARRSVSRRLELTFLIFELALAVPTPRLEDEHLGLFLLAHCVGLQSITDGCDSRRMTQQLR